MRRFRSIRRLIRKLLVFAIIPLCVLLILFKNNYNDSQIQIDPVNTFANSKVVHSVEHNQRHSDKHVELRTRTMNLSANSNVVYSVEERPFKSVKNVKLRRSNQTTPRITSLVDIPTNFNYFHATRNIKYTILWFNAAPWISRHLQLDTCEYNNCQWTEDRNLLHNSSAVIFGISMQKMGASPPVSPRQRNPDQIWVFYSLEPPVYHVFQTAYKNPSWHNTMNWSMTFNLDSDVFAPFGTFKTRDTVLERDYDKIFAMKTKMALWVVSNCGSMSKRNEYVSALKKSGLQVDIYGSCGRGRYSGDISTLIKQYKFYLSLENSFCKYYVTEKVFKRSADDVITVIRGGADYSQLLPNDTYVDANKFENASSLAQYLMSLGSDKDTYIAMLKRKDRYYTLNEGDFAYQYAMCDLCRKLNTHDGTRKTYGNLVEEVLKEGRCINRNDIVVK